ncbi:MAG: ATP-binding protein [candidate division KSB1 bacterium]|nr:ATP-binding protein [candidate division KSB1 bacterium]MDZ7300669.1 ATP-binding protein [candidate division KSB1 bacterium]MDZ7309805.1 ATP-binding protein [candidate division KSB1 bacterium]
MTAIFLVLIFVPCGLLGYLGWRAIKYEKLLSRQKIVESYRQFIHLATRDLDLELENVQARLQAAVEKILARPGAQPAVEQLDSLTKLEPIIFSCALLRGPGQVVYPPEVSLKRGGFPDDTEQGEMIAHEYDLYNELATRGEKLEYRAKNLDSAIAVYRQILAETSSPRLHAMALSRIGRALTKKADWQAALETYERLLHNYPEERDLNKTDLRLLAQYQIAVCLENLDREQEAVDALLRMYKDLLERGDTINLPQYSHFRDWIKTLQAEILSEPELPQATYYREQFQRLAAQSKKRLSEKYFVQLLDDKLRELIVQRKPYRPLIRYFSGQADEEPFLLGYRPMPDPSSSRISGLLGFRINLTQLRERILPALMRHLQTSEAIVLAILDNNGNYVIGTTKPRTTAVATLALDSPFEFWHVGIFLDDGEPASLLADFSTVLQVWLISLLLFSIFLGAHIFIRYARHEAHLSELKSTFVSRVSHELRTPLTSIKMLAEHLEMQLRQRAVASEQDFRARIEQCVSVIYHESDRLGRLIENVLNFSKIERGVKQYTFEYEMPAVVVQKAIDSFRPHAETQGFIIKTQIDDSLPELLMDADGITQAILNLLSNAVKYSDKEKIIEVRARRDQDQVCIEVEDRGIGISATQISRIFEEFYSLDHELNSRRQGGMGLGLTLVKHIVQDHGGTIKVRSKEGKGSTFIIALPIPPGDGVQATESANP